MASFQEQKYQAQKAAELQEYFHHTARNARHILQKALDEVEYSEFEFEHRAIPYGYMPDIVSLAQTTSDMLATLRRATRNLYCAAQGPSPLDELPAVPLVTQAEVMNMGVDVRLEDDAIYIKLPMLRSEYSRSARAATERHPVIFAEEITALILQHQDFEEYDFEKFERKLLHYLYVYSTSRRGISCADNDNHETKYVQDAVAAFLPGGDSPFTCSILSSAVRTSEIPEGTYVTVTKMQDGAKADAEVVAFWRGIEDDQNENS